MRIILILLLVLLISSCQIPLTGVNKFAEIYKGMPKNQVFTKIKQRPDFSRQINYMNEIMIYEVYNIKLSTYKQEHQEKRTSYNPRIEYEVYDVTTVTDYFYPYVILYKNGYVFYQGFLWEFKNDRRIEINELGNILWSEINE